MNDDSHFLMSLGAEMSSTKRDYYAQRCREIADAIEQLHTDVAEWKQAASVEANLRREFLNRAEKAEAALPLVGVERREDVARAIEKFTAIFERAPWLKTNDKAVHMPIGGMGEHHQVTWTELARIYDALSGSGVEREDVAPWPLDGPIAAFFAAWPAFAEWWTSIDNGYGRKFTVQDIPPEPFEAFAAALPHTGQPVEGVLGILPRVIAHLENGEDHNEGAFDESCDTCLLLRDLRALSPAASPQQREGE